MSREENGISCYENNSFKEVYNLFIFSYGQFKQILRITKIK